MEKEQPKFSILMFPWLAYSHVLPFLGLAKRLCKRSFHIYFCSSAINLGSIRNNMGTDLHTATASIDLIELQLPSLPELPSQFHTTKNLPPNLLPVLLQAFQMSSSSFSEILNALSPDLLIYDFFQPWAAKLALSQGIPSVYFATAGAAPFSFFYHLYTYGTTTTFPYQEIYLLDHEKVDLRAPVELKVKDADEDFAFGNFKLSSEIVLVKSLGGVEGKYIDYLSALCQKKVVPTGPIVQEPNDEDEDCSEILQWLSKKERFSTVFICFGSEHFLSKEQILEIAKGLELCESNFLWAIRFPVEEEILCIEDAFPSGFLDRVKERGLILQKWAPQAKILSCPSIGGFVSHCGWSSIMESMYFGVPVIAMPIKFDQPINARLVVEASAGVEVGRDENGLFSAKAVAEAINKVIMETNEEGLRNGARKLSQKMKNEEEQAENEAAQELLWLCKKSKQ
ncbi:UNVERIFIED_CONTAM: UDP-glucosyltransferase 29 [Sesamum latifolium]|uniref:Glycosyltransferase n=1 Tax=Sesamum latifolium TaxID=2727402 RepID=A0AAW2XUA6_9LAMI